MLLAAIGVYGVLAFLVNQRTREIGVRMALGAGRQDVLRLVLRDALGLAVVGVVLGVAASLALTRILASMLFEVSATDATAFAAAPLLLVVVALTAALVPAYRATRMSPVTALRSE
jgi:ABC-type antimicrobial peptide transport system permease subunit